MSIGAIRLFPILRESPLFDQENRLLLATPWTLISNLALCVNAGVTYVKVKDSESGEIYYLSEPSLANFYRGKDESAYEILEKMTGDKLAGIKYQPLFPYFKNQENAFRVLVDDYVSAEDGTGIVHQAPAYGEEDFRVGSAAGIGLVDPLDDEGCFSDQVPEYAGQFVKDADKNIIKDLKVRGDLLRHDTIVHRYPFCERTDTPLIYRAIPAWYVKVEDFKDRLVENNRKINWVPAHLRDGRMGKWLENARDWAVSRNRYWGTPLPIWVSETDPEKFEVFGSIRELEEKVGVKLDDIHEQLPDQKLVDVELEREFDLVRNAMLLGRSLRAKHKIKTRQPLAQMLVITRHETDQKAIERGMALLQEELNVKSVKFSTDEASYVALILKPNLRTLGKRLGKKLGEIRNNLATMNENHKDVAKLLEELAAKGSVEILGESLTEDDFLIDRSAKGDELVATEAGVTVLLDVKLTEELVQEGLAREVVNRIQKLRKDSDLKVSDRIQLWLEGDVKIITAVKTHNDYIVGETLAVSLATSESSDSMAEAEHIQPYQIEGMDCRVGLRVSR